MQLEGSYREHVNSQSDDENGYVLYGPSTYHPFQQVRIHLSKDKHLEFKKTKSCIIIDSLQSCSDFLESQLISRGTSYIAIILLPLLEKPKPYCVGIYCISKGSDAETLDLVYPRICYDPYPNINSRFQKSTIDVGVRIVTNPGDGSLQLTKFASKQGFQWLTQLTVPLQYMYSTDGQNPTFSMQDLLHNIKKGHNNVKSLETKPRSL